MFPVYFVRLVAMRRHGSGDRVASRGCAVKGARHSRRVQVGWGAPAARAVAGFEAVVSGSRALTAARAASQVLALA
jgi:hypothetical protein